MPRGLQDDGAASTSPLFPFLQTSLLQPVWKGGGSSRARLSLKAPIGPSCLQAFRGVPGRWVHPWAELWGPLSAANNTHRQVSLEVGGCVLLL